jgi:hypothetical protein
MRNEGKLRRANIAVWLCCNDSVVLKYGDEVISEFKIKIWLFWWLFSIWMNFIFSVNVYAVNAGLTHFLCIVEFILSHQSKSWQKSIKETIGSRESEKYNLCIAFFRYFQPPKQALSVDHFLVIQTRSLSSHHIFCKIGFFLSIS